MPCPAPTLMDLTAAPISRADAHALSAALLIPGVLIAAARDIAAHPETGWQVWRTITRLYPASAEAWLLTQLAAQLTGRRWGRAYAAIQIGSHCPYRPVATLTQLREHLLLPGHAPQPVTV